MTKKILAFLGAFALAAGAYAGPEPFSGNDKEVMQSVAPVEEWYRDTEWNVAIWGAYVFTGNGAFEFPEDAFDEEAEFDRYLGSDDAWGGGIDLKYFFRRYFGVGIEAFGLAVHRDTIDERFLAGENGQPFEPREEDIGVGAVLGTFTLRYPVGDSRFAPYIFAGFGAIFGGGDVESFEFEGRGNGTDYFEVYRGGDDTELLGQFGGGLEVRVTRRIGILSDFSWNVVNKRDNNFGMVRAGANFAF